ncbi:hypothetical protein EDEG_01386 [Edhazardia aedis USNM 41457]|uniref:Uncharacterized protein n=1 Tax=Edhazardia aedis (strain USNM 41457) TaxID=1003232 RepID=J9D9B6_EDHAE|nr:hypothetical protein EDEG_01386 [Edhazardia aedis USNM 41457]|eukprot:EJW04371.1 hypothetical protein EDEG_01386 [Edhazardia aedis USNM 41457]
MKNINKVNIELPHHTDDDNESEDIEYEDNIGENEIKNIQKPSKKRRRHRSKNARKRKMPDQGVQDDYEDESAEEITQLDAPEKPEIPKKQGKRKRKMENSNDEDDIFDSSESTGIRKRPQKMVAPTQSNAKDLTSDYDETATSHEDFDDISPKNKKND